MGFKLANWRLTKSKERIRAKCPSCGHDVIFVSLQEKDISTNTNSLGIRICPNPACSSVLFFIFDNSHGLVDTYPRLRIDFEKERIPDGVLSKFEEAITCHSEGCYIASAIMIRRTLEEICKDRGSTGKDLKERIKSLRSKIIIPDELMQGMDELRLLGNDAAHIEATVFDKVDKEEVEVGIELSKEILKATYQYEGLLQKLKGLKKS